MKTLAKTATASLIAVSLSAGTASAQMAPHSTDKGHAAAGNTIVDVAVANGSFTTLVAALKAANLVTALQGDGPFTVFAPNDAAFAKLPAGTVEALLKDPAKLAAILTYHVVPGKITAADVMKMGKGNPATLNGKMLNVKVDGGTVHVGAGTVIAADVMASNGVIHVIDTVLLPPTGK